MRNALPSHGSRKVRQHYSDEVKRKAFELKAEGMSVPRIADTLRVSNSNVHNWLANEELRQKFGTLTIPKHLDGISAQRKALEEQLRKLEAEEKRLIEMKAFKLVPCWDGKGVLIQKEASQIGLLLEDAEELVILLDDYMKKVRE